MVFGFSLLRAWQEQREDPVVILGLDAVGVDLDRQRDRPGRTGLRAALGDARRPSRERRPSLGPESRRVRPFTCKSRSDFLTPGTSVMMTKSSPLRNTFSGG